MIALIDADVLRYQLGFVYQRKVVDDYGEIVIVPSPSHVWKPKVDAYISDIMKNAGATSCKLFLTGKGNFREKIAKKKVYKGTRHAAKPVLYDELGTYFVDEWDAEVITGMEADDALTITQYEDYMGWQGHDYEDCETIICTTDKDLRMAPG